MKNFDYLSLDGRSLYMLKQIYEHRSVTEAAHILGVTQSSVSHSLDRLRGLLGDPLFIKVGRAMVPTERVESMMGEIDQVLSGIETLFNQSAFDPAKSDDRFSIIGNDFDHELLVPPIYAKLKKEAPHCSLRTYQFRHSDHAYLKQGVADMELCPFPPKDTSDLVVSKVCSDRMITYFDPNIREAPKNLDDFLASDHAILSFGVNETTPIDEALTAMGQKRRVAYLGPNFSATAAVVRGSCMLATAPSRLAQSIFRDLAWVETPLALEPIDVYMIWHVRNRHSLRHKWFRELVRTVARDLPQTSQACEQVERRRSNTKGEEATATSSPQRTAAFSE